MEDVKPNNSEIKRDAEGKIMPGSGPLNPAGRPKGKTLKEFAREMLMSMTDEEKREYMATLPKEIVWKMAEGNPHTTTDVTTGGKPITCENIKQASDAYLYELIHGADEKRGGGGTGEKGIGQEAPS